MKWINVKDRIPPQDGTPFLGYDPKDDEKIYVLIYARATNYSDECYREAAGECYFTWNPTHWMPLPEPPKDE